MEDAEDVDGVGDGKTSWPRKRRGESEAVELDRPIKNEIVIKFDCLQESALYLLTFHDRTLCRLGICIHSKSRAF